jgi:hypothetical protein
MMRSILLLTFIFLVTRCSVDKFLIDTNETMILEATYYGGCGFSVKTKENILDLIKLELVTNYNIPKDNITIKMKNNKMYDKITLDSSEKDPELMEDIKNKINIYEFNIFVVQNGIRRLVGSSDYRSDFYFEYLAGINLKGNIDSFLPTISKNILGHYES